MAKYFVISFIILVATVLNAAAVTDNLTQSQIREAREFGRANKGEIEKTLMHMYSINGAGPGSHEVVVRTKWCKLALLEGIKSQQGKDATAFDQEPILQDPHLQIDITVYGSSIDFARGFTVTAIQGEKRISPDIAHADHFQSPVYSEQSKHGVPSYYATIRCYFLYSALDLKKPLKLELKKEHGLSFFNLDLGKYK